MSYCKEKKRKEVQEEEGERQEARLTSNWKFKFIVTGIVEDEIYSHVPVISANPLDFVRASETDVAVVRLLGVEGEVAGDDYCVGGEKEERENWKDAKNKHIGVSE